MYNIKSVFVIVIILLLSIASIAQTISFVEPRFKLKSTAPMISSFDNNGKHYILYESYNSKAPLRVDLQLDSYDENGKPLNSFMIDETMNGAEPNYFEGVFPIAGKIVLFKMGYDTKTKKTNLYAYTLDDEGNKGEEKFLTFIQGLSMFNSGSFNVVTSPDTKKILVFSNLPHVKKQNEKIAFAVFDSDLNIINSKEIELPYISRKNKVNHAFINNEGNVFLLKKVYAKKKIPDLEMVFVYSPELELVKESAHIIGNIGVISTYKSMINSEGNLVFGGLYYDYKKSGFNVKDPDGTFISSLKANGELVSNYNAQTYSGSFITNQILNDALGNHYLLLESVLEKNETVGSGTAPTYNKIYTNKDAFVVKYSSNNTFDWIYKIARDAQTSTNDNAKSYRMWATVLPSNKIAVFYKDSWARHDGVKRNVITPPVIYWRGNIIETITTEGQLESKHLIRDQRFGGDIGKYFFMPQTGYMLKGSIRMISFRNNELVSTIIEL